MSTYSKVSKFVLGNKLSLFSDIVLLTASGYLMFKKALGFSISGWLLNNAFHQPMVNAYVYTSGFILIAAILVKIVSLICEKFPAVKHTTVEPEEISECLQVMNNEIMHHIDKCNSKESPNIKKLGEQHSFDVNTRLIAESLAEHIRKSISTIKIKRKDLFISLYSYDKDNQKLKYELHYDPKRDLVQTKMIPLADKKYASYECVKCIKSSNSTAYIVDKNTYSKGNSKRYKSFNQYMGCKLEVGDIVFGYLNIEFHNYDVFADEDEMQDFMEENIFPFKLLFEYQYLKGEFFSKFEKFDKHWGI